MTSTFGTDGLRGVAGRDLPPGLAVALGRAFTRHLGAAGPVLLARDTRRSGPMLEAALSAGIAAEGADVESYGVLPTPGLAHACDRRRLAGAMISASHNPFPDNGIKLFAPGGRKLRDGDEAAIEAELTTLLDGRVPGTEGDAVGVLRRVPSPGSAYVEHLVSAVPPGALEGLRLVLDCANGAAFESAPAALRALGADLTVLNATPDGTNINDGCGSTHPAVIQRAVVGRRADAGLAFDGDADRVIAVDERGGLVDGDHILTVLALDLQAKGRLRSGAIVTTVMANLGLRRALGAAGIAVVETPVGDRHVLSAMEEGGHSLGGEQSGHVIVADHAVTGDGPLVGILLLELLRRAGRPLSELASVVSKCPQELRSVAVGDRDGLSAAEGFWARVREVEADLGPDGRVLVRPSGTEPLVRVMVEAVDGGVAARSADRLARALTEALGSRR